MCTSCFLDRLVRTRSLCRRFCFCLWRFDDEKERSKFGHEAFWSSYMGRWGSCLGLFLLNCWTRKSMCCLLQMVSKSPTASIQQLYKVIYNKSYEGIKSCMIVCIIIYRMKIISMKNLETPKRCPWPFSEYAWSGSHFYAKKSYRRRG